MTPVQTMIRSPVLTFDEHSFLALYHTIQARLRLTADDFLLNR
jgi:hypothetical protein